jgi:hypothetical protein
MNENMSYGYGLAITVQEGTRKVSYLADLKSETSYEARSEGEGHVAARKQMGQEVVETKVIVILGEQYLDV